MAGWIGQNWREVRSTVLDIINQRLLPLLGDTEGRLQTKPCGSVSAPFRQSSDGTFLIHIAPTWRDIQFTRTFWTANSLGVKTRLNPSLLIWTTHLQATGAVIETLTPFNLGNDIWAASLPAPIFGVNSSYHVNTGYYHQWRFELVPGRVQVQRKEFQFIL